MCTSVPPPLIGLPLTFAFLRTLAARLAWNFGHLICVAIIIPAQGLVCFALHYKAVSSVKWV